MDVTPAPKPAAPKPFTWSYSRLKNFETCPKRHWHIDIAKDVKEDDSEALTWGNDVHKHLANRIGIGKTLPAGMAQFEPWAERILTGGGNIKTELKLAINKDFGPTGYFDKDVWYRGVADVLKIVGPVALAIDWKTGKILEDAVQLALMSACVFAHYPEIQKVRTEFVWLKEGDNVSTREDFSREDMPGLWRSLWPRIEQLRLAHETTNYPPTPGRLCARWCPVKQCPHNGG